MPRCIPVNPEWPLCEDCVNYTGSPDNMVNDRCALELPDVVRGSNVPVVGLPCIDMRTLGPCGLGGMFFTPIVVEASK